MVSVSMVARKVNACTETCDGGDDYRCGTAEHVFALVLPTTTNIRVPTVGTQLFVLWCATVVAGQARLLFTRFIRLDPRIIYLDLVISKEIKTQ